MLVLSRRERQTIHIGDDIKITVVAIRGDQVRIGIEAGKETLVLRGELMAYTRADRKPTDRRECD